MMVVEVEKKTTVKSNDSNATNASNKTNSTAQTSTPATSATPAAPAAPAASSTNVTSGANATSGGNRTLSPEEEELARMTPEEREEYELQKRLKAAKAANLDKNSEGVKGSNQR